VLHLLAHFGDAPGEVTAPGGELVYAGGVAPGSGSGVALRPVRGEVRLYLEEQSRG
jgi:hypothetical protein